MVSRARRARALLHRRFIGMGDSEIAPPCHCPSDSVTPPNHLHHVAMAPKVRFTFRLMNSALLDPNNHVPEVSPDDGWGDADGVITDVTVGATHVLPPRRGVMDRSPTAAVAAVENGLTGLRIDSNLTRGQSADSPQRLEVQEISGTIVRLDPPASALPKVPRQITFHERPAGVPGGKKPPDESLQWGLERRRPTYWILGAGAAVAIIVVLGMMVLPAINAPNAARAVPDAKPFVEEKIEGIEVMNLMLVKQPEAQRIFHAYATASGVDEIIPLVQNGHSLKAVLRANWQSLEISKSWEPAADTSWKVSEFNGRSCGRLQGSFPDHTKFSAYFINEGGQLRLDWKATCGFGTATFGQLKNGQGDPGEIRGEISSALYYNDIFPESNYQSYRLISPDGEIVIWCYARRDEGAPLFHPHDARGEFQSSWKVTLRLAPGPTGAMPNQWLIGELLHLDWVTP